MDTQQSFTISLKAYELDELFNCTSYELLFAYELQVTIYCTSYKLLLAYELWVNFYMRVTSYFLTMSYNKDKDDKTVYDNKVMIKNYSLGSFFDKELGGCSFSCY